ncbi:uncharacterized protein LOC134679329 [Cydia fagiglandana]|uniref:uncharacterized protein LOC134679329 n=1 Tax=Cydia fagiglandana TaxID=1458189 RepID=UPI002FEE31D8
MNQIQYISRNGGSVLLHDGYQYHKKKEYKNQNVFWNEKIEKEKPHTCVQNFNKNIEDLQLDICVKKSKQLDGVPLPQIYQSTVSSLQDEGIDLLCKIPPFRNVKTRMYYNRNKEAGVKKINFGDVMDVEIPKKFEPFLLADYEFEGYRIIIFCSMESRHLMGKIKMFLSDGTFKSCPKPFAQLYVIHGDLGSTENSTNIIPLVYAMLSSKTKHIYETLFHLIKSRIPDWQPEKYKTDYEEAAMQAVTHVFPDIEFNGCYYHSNKSIWRKGRELGLTTNKNTRRIVALTAVLSLLPFNKIHEGWAFIKQDTLELQDTGRVPKFFKYLYKGFLQQRFIYIT